MRKLELFLLTVILILGFLLRLYRFDNPIADWHSWRQADTSAVSRNFLKYGFDILHPRFDDISNVASGLDNPEGWRFVEFPIYNLFQAGLFQLFDVFTLEQWGRLVTIFSSLASIIFLFLLVRKYIGKTEAFLASLFFAFLPFSIYYSRTILPDQMMVMASLGGIYFFDRWIEDKSKVKSQKSKLQLKSQNLLFYITSIIFTALALLLKPFAIFFTIPMVYLAFSQFGFGLIKKWQLWVFLVLSIMPLILWRWWMQQFPEGIPAYTWLFNENNIRFKGAFFYWIFGERIAKLILGYFGVTLLILGLFKKKNEKDYLFSISFLLSSLLYLVVIAGGNVRHDYYQILIIPTVSIFLARGTTFLLSQAASLINRLIASLILVVSIVFTLGFSWFYVRDYFNINNWTIVEAGRKADQILPSKAKVIALYQGDTSFLYQTNRRGWSIFEKPIEEMIKMGAEYLVIAAPTKSDFEGFGKMYKTVASSSSYLILELR